MPKFTPGETGFYWRIMPSRNSAIWDSMMTSMRTMAYRGAGTRGQSVFSFNPSAINSKNIKWLLALDKAGTREETREALREVGSYIAHEVIARIFAEEGKASTGDWPELADSTIKWRIRKGYSTGPILQASGELYNIATSDEAINEIKLGKKPRVIMGGANWPSGEPDNLMEKYFVHMGGSWSRLYGGAPIPPRPFMPESPEDFTEREEEHIKNIFREHIYNLIERT